jgi:colanic acid/amylovoran biosynthesis glycosyltransferase
LRNQNKYDILEIRDYYSSNNNPSSSTWVYDQVLSLSKMGYNPLVISPTPVIPFKRIFRNKFRLYDSPSVEIEDYKGTHVLRPPYFRIPRQVFVGFTLRNLSHCIEKYGSREGIKIIHAHFGQNGFAALKLKDKLNVPLITSFYGYDSGRLAGTYKPFYKALIKKGDLFLVLSHDMKNDLLKLGFPEEKILIHHLGIDINRFSVINNVSDDFFIFSTVCRLDKSKGVHFVIEAFHDFLKADNNSQYNYQLRIVGGGYYENKLKKLVKRYNLQSRVHFINNLIMHNAREIVLDEMKKCNVFILASYCSKRGLKEGTPIVLMEAQACGKPCISTSHAGIPEVVKDKVSGFIVEEASVNEIEKYMHVLAKDAEIYSRFSISARKHIEEKFNQKVQMERLKNIINQMIVS